jgi:DNA-directed RNA polymerase subunit delta
MLKDISREDLELLSYTDLSYKILKESKKPLNTPLIFKEVCRLLDYNETQYVNKIGDFYTSLNLDKRFVLLDSNEWELREKHSVAIEIDDEDDVVEDEEEEYEEEIHEDEEEIIDEEIDSLEDEELEDEDMDELEDLTIVDEEEIE